MVSAILQTDGGRHDVHQLWSVQFCKQLASGRSELSGRRPAGLSNGGRNLYILLRSTCTSLQTKVYTTMF
jgi:hypothetical protein